MKQSLIMKLFTSKYVANKQTNENAKQPHTATLQVTAGALCMNRTPRWLKGPMMGWVYSSADRKGINKWLLGYGTAWCYHPSATTCYTISSHSTHWRSVLTKQHNAAEERVVSINAQCRYSICAAAINARWWILLFVMETSLNTRTTETLRAHP